MNARRARKGQPKGSGRNLRSRVALAAFAIAVGLFSTAASIANAIQRADASTAFALAPWNAVIEAAFANQLFVEAPLGADASEAGDRARSALIKDATSAKALTVLGFQAELAQDTTLRDRIFTYSSVLSRRELRSQIWAAENAVSQGDIVDALHHYDIALSTSGAARTLLFPTLTNAISEPLVRRHLIDLMRSQPNWAPLFVNYASLAGRDFVAIADFFRAGTAIGLPLDENLRSSVVNGLLAEGKTYAAWSYYASFRAGAKRERSRDSRFVHVADVRSGFDWVPGTQAGVRAELLKSGATGLLDFALPPSMGGTIVSQRQLLPTGNYRLHGRATLRDPAEDSRPFWTITCDSGVEILLLNLPEGSGDIAHFSGDFIVPANCPQQTLSLVARPSNAVEGIAGQIQEALIEPTRSGTGQ